MSPDNHAKPTLMQLIRLDDAASTSVFIVGIFALFYLVHILFDIQLALGRSSRGMSPEAYATAILIGLGLTAGFLGFRLFRLHRFCQRAVVIVGAVVSSERQANGGIVVTYQYEIQSERLEGKSNLNRLHPLRSLSVGDQIKLIVDTEKTHKSLIFDVIFER